MPATIPVVVQIGFDRLCYQANRLIILICILGEFDDLISALRTGDVFGEDMAKLKRGRRSRATVQRNGIDTSRERINKIKS